VAGSGVCGVSLVAVGTAVGGRDSSGPGDSAVGLDASVGSSVCVAVGVFPVSAFVPPLCAPSPPPQPANAIDPSNTTIHWVRRFMDSPTSLRGMIRGRGLLPIYSLRIL
jgi:hypothetical protein